MTTQTICSRTDDAVASWMPTRWPATLTGTEDFVTDGDRLILLVEKCWRMPNGEKLRLDDWQKWLLRHVLERYPEDYPDPRLAGRLRWRQVLVSLGRQNGKSLLGGILGLYGLVQHVQGPEVVGIATSVEQAGVIYGRVKHAVESSPALTRRLRATGTRGIRRRKGSGSYMLKASKYEALQGIPITLGLADELHLLPPSVWGAMVNGQRAQTDAMMLGITTAGDADSELLLALYAQADAALADPDDAHRFGAFIWEAPTGSTIDTPGAIEAANPAVACGRISVDTVRADVRNLPLEDQQRYTLNQFVTSAQPWLPLEFWTRAARGGPDPVSGGELVFAFDKTPSWEYATVAVAVKDADELVRTDLVAALNKPSLAQLERIAVRLRKKHGSRVTFVMDGYGLAELAKRLKDRGYKVRVLKRGETYEACSSGYALLAKGKLSHSDDPLLGYQIPRAKRKNQGTEWRVVGAQIDAVMAMLIASWVATVAKTKPSRQLF